MSSNLSRHARRLLPVIVGAGLAGAAFGPDVSAGAPLRCEIEVSGHGSAISLQAVVLAASAAEGTYRLEVSGSGSGGSSSIAQSGAFSVGAGARSAVGAVTLAGNGGSYVARLSVTSGAGTSRCTKRISGSL